MTEPTPPLAPVPTRLSWRRLRVYSWGILLILAIWLFAAVIMVRQQPKRVVDNVLAQLPFPTSTGQATWLDQHVLEIKDVRLGDFFSAEKVTITVDWKRFLRHHIAVMQVTGGQVFTGSLDEAMKKFTSNSGVDWTIDRLEILRGTVMLNNIGPDLPSVPVRLGVKDPLVLNYIHLSKPDKSEVMTRERMIDVEGVNIVSPFDPLAPVLSFPLTRIRFTYTELWNHHIREIDFIRPTMFLGQDLFWFGDEFKKERATLPAEGLHAPWDVGHLEVKYGQLAVNAFGQPAVHFPFFFETKVDNIRLDQLDKISAKSTVSILRLDQDYPDYKIRIVNLSGKIEFSLPPSDVTANNVVPTVHIDELSWNNIPVTDVWSSVTFDPAGIYGKLGGNCERGYLKGNFEVYYTKGFTWNADFFADKINCQPVVEKIAGKYLDLTGTLDGKIEVQGRATEVLNCQGLLKMDKPGLLQLKSTDGLLDHLSGNTSMTKQDLMKITVASFQTYPYQSGQFKVDYKPDGGVGTLKLDGANGQRQLDIYWHPYASSKVANVEDNQ